MSTRTRRRSPRKRKRKSSEEEEESSSSSEQSPPAKKQRTNNTKTKNNRKKTKKKKVTKKTKEEEDDFIYIVQGRLEGCDENEGEFDSDDGYPSGFDTVTYDAYRGRVAANQAAVAIYKRNTKKKYQKISTRYDYQNGLFDKASPFFTKRNLPEAWGGVRYHAWVLKKKLKD